MRLRGGPQRGVSDPRQLVGDYTNPILKPQAAEVVKKHGEMELSGVGSPTPTNQCWPEPVPYIFWAIAMRMLQPPDKMLARSGGMALNAAGTTGPYVYAIAIAAWPSTLNA